MPENSSAKAKLSKWQITKSNAKSALSNSFVNTKTPSCSTLLLSGVALLVSPITLFGSGVKTVIDINTRKPYSREQIEHSIDCLNALSDEASIALASELKSRYRGQSSASQALWNQMLKTLYYLENSFVMTTEGKSEIRNAKIEQFCSLHSIPIEMIDINHKDFQPSIEECFAYLLEDRERIKYFKLSTYFNYHQEQIQQQALSVQFGVAPSYFNSRAISQKYTDVTQAWQDYSHLYALYFKKLFTDFISTDINNGKAMMQHLMTMIGDSAEQEESGKASLALTCSF